MRMAIWCRVGWYRRRRMPATPPTEVTPEAVPAALVQGAMLLVASPRLATDWRRRLVAGAGDVVPTPAVEDWASWLAELARAHADLPVLYTQLQELQLWERIIATDMGSGVAGSGLARHAAEAYRLMREYRIDVGELAGGGEEAEALGRWIVAMQSRLVQDDRLLAADLPAALLPYLGTRVSVRHILLDGFDRTTPMQQALLQGLEAKGIRLATMVAEAEPATPTLTICADAESECRHVAGHVAAILSAEPATRIGIVTAGQAPAMLGRILDEVLRPPGKTAMQAVAMAGNPLAARPLIRQLLDVLALAGHRGASHAELAPLLFSPGVRGHAEEYPVRAAFDAKLREDNRYYLSFRALQGMAAGGGMSQLAGVVESLATLDKAGRTAGEWVGTVHALLQDLGFLQADIAGRTAGEIRELNAFRECLASLVAVDAVQGRVSWGEFLALLSSVCKETPFALDVAYPQVSVLPLQQVAGLRFDCVFALGFDEDALPLPARPSPLLPFSLQRRHGLACATPTLAFEASRLLWHGLRQAAPRLHLSYAHRRDERELNASPLLVDMVAGFPEPPTKTQALCATVHYDDAPSVPLGPEDEAVTGGSDIIKNQSACPFRAFATHRLALAPLGVTRPGIEPREKGSLLHHALQYLWETLASQQALLAQDGNQIDALIGAAIDHAWSKARIALAETSRDYERRRMAAVLQEWLEEERQRPSFRVERCEKPYSLRLPTRGALQFTVRLKADRIDRDDEGHKILIDYKSGQKQAAGKWIGERMEQPQLPLYSMAEGLGTSDAVCFARVRSGECGFEGLSGEDTGIQGIETCDGKRHRPDDWPGLLDAWRQDIDALAAEFVAGRAEVVPRNRKACDHCGLEAVCRIDEIGFAHDVDADDEGDGT
jgi:probable DNA repair protein